MFIYAAEGINYTFLAIHMGPWRPWAELKPL